MALSLKKKQNTVKNCCILILLGLCLLCISCQNTEETKQQAGIEKHTAPTTEIPVVGFDASVTLKPSVTSTPAPTPVPTPTPTPTPAPTPTPSGLCGARYYPNAFAYDGGTVQDAYSYKSENVDISVRIVEDDDFFNKRLCYVVADIKIQDITSLKTASAGENPLGQECETMEWFDMAVSPILSMNGDYAMRKDFGCIVRNGEVCRSVDTTRYDMCALTRDGVLHIFEAGTFSCEDILKLEPWQAWCFGPSLLDAEGHAKTKFNSSLYGNNPRSVLGYFEPGHYCFVVVDGRQERYSVGLDLWELSVLMERIGCKAAYNMDGGASSGMRFLGQQMNQPQYVRKIPDIIYITEPD